MSSLEKTLLLVMSEVSRHHSRAHKRFDDFVARGTCEVSEESGGRAFRPRSHDHCQEFSELTAGLDMTHVATTAVPRSFLVALVSEYDFFIRSFFSSMLLAKPDLMKGSHRTLEISRLLTINAIADAYEWVVEEEMDELMRGNHPEQFEYLETRFNIGRWEREQDPLWRTFIEVTERRNLFVHTGGSVSNQYLEVCRKNLVDIGKINKGDEHGLARNLLSFATTTLKNKLHDEEELLYFKVNLAIALKNLGEKVEFARCMASEEWYKKRDLFQLAEAVLNERYHDAVILMRRVGDGVHKADYRRWPLYEKFRDLPEFRSTFRELFGEDLDAHDHSHL
jgi:hypothetical protein